MMKRLEIISDKSKYFTRTWQLILKYLHNQVESYMNVICFDYLTFHDFTETNFFFYHTEYLNVLITVNFF